MGSRASQRRTLQRNFLMLPFVVFILLLITWITSDTFLHTVGFTRLMRYRLDPILSTLPGAQDVVIVVKTGASEIAEKLPVHFTTTFKSSPNILIFSDLSQRFHGLQIHDALTGFPQFISHVTNASREELDYYYTLQSIYKSGGSLIGLDTKLAWQIDRYKNVPILQQVYDMKPQAKWFFFMDADTSLLWSNLLLYLSKLDHSVPLYLGAPVHQGVTKFAHGGSGYIISRAAASLIAELSEDDARKQWEITEKLCCGDLALAVALKDHGVKMSGAWPNIQGETPDSLDYTIKHWCFAAVTWHHMSSEDIQAMWNWEKDMLQKKMIPTYESAFNHFISPHLNTGIKNSWDNDSSDDLYTTTILANGSSVPVTIESCQQACQENRDCVQYKHTKHGHEKNYCHLSKVFKFGHSDVTDGGEKFTSGWMIDRIERFVKESRCKDVRWELPEVGLVEHKIKSVNGIFIDDV